MNILVVFNLGVYLISIIFHGHEKKKKSHFLILSFSSVRTLTQM